MDDTAANRPHPALLLGLVFLLVLWFVVAQAQTRPTEKESALASSEADYAADRGSESKTIWYGRQLAYSGRYKDAIWIYTLGLEAHPDSFKLLRHRGHRLISTRDFEAAVADLSRAANIIRDKPDEVEQDGMPNAAGIPRSTSHTNIYYHLGLAHYLLGNWAESQRAYTNCLELSQNDDMRCAATYWLALLAKRRQQDDQLQQLLAPIHADMDILENFAYHDLLLYFKGEKEVEAIWQPGAEGLDGASTGYGVGAWHFLNGRRDAAIEAFNAVYGSGQQYAFGFIAAEAELNRL